MLARFETIVAFVLTVAVSQPLAHAARGYHWPVDPMCHQADLIIEGIHESGNTVRVEKAYKGEPPLWKGAESIEVVDLQKHSKACWEGLRGPKATVESRRLVAFLEYDKESESWVSISTSDDRGVCGSCGVFWFDDSTCYGYAQAVSPGPYRLFAAKDSDWRTPRTIDVLRAEIAQGLANSREWRRSVSIEDPEQKAKAIARYLLKSTSPKGDKGSYMFHVREPMRSLGKQAVPSLIEVMKSAPAGESVGEAVLILYDIGPPAAEAVPALRDVLAKPDCDCIGYVLSALGSIGDARALSDIEKYRDDADQDVANAARKAIAKMREYNPHLPND